MAAAPTQCPRCGGSIEQGFVPDFNHGRSQVKTSIWVAGEPERSFWFGVKLGGRERRPITAFRCRSCGHLELYARQA